MTFWKRENYVEEHIIGLFVSGRETLERGGLREFAGGWKCFVHGDDHMNMSIEMYRSVCPKRQTFIIFQQIFKDLFIFREKERVSVAGEGGGQRERKQENPKQTPH